MSKSFFVDVKPEFSDTFLEAIKDSGVERFEARVWNHPDCRIRFGIRADDGKPFSSDGAPVTNEQLFGSEVAIEILRLRKIQESFLRNGGKFRVGAHSSAMVQKCAFKAGYTWVRGSRFIRNTDRPFLYCNGVILSGSNEKSFDANLLPEFEADDFIDAFWPITTTLPKVLVSWLCYSRDYLVEQRDKGWPDEKENAKLSHYRTEGSWISPELTAQHQADAAAYANAAAEMATKQAFAASMLIKDLQPEEYLVDIKGESYGQFLKLIKAARDSDWHGAEGVLFWADVWWNHYEEVEGVAIDPTTRLVNPCYLSTGDEILLSIDQAIEKFFTPAEEESAGDSFVQLKEESMLKKLARLATGRIACSIVTAFLILFMQFGQIGVKETMTDFKLDGDKVAAIEIDGVWYEKDANGIWRDANWYAVKNTEDLGRYESFILNKRGDKGLILDRAPQSTNWSIAWRQ